MTFKDNIQIDRSRGSRGRSGRGVAIGGSAGLGGLLLVGLFLFLGGDPRQAEYLLNAQQQWSNETTQGTGDDFSHCQTGADANEHADCRLVATAQSVDQFWQEELPRQYGAEYTMAGLVVFEDSVQSGCGFATAATGPFYCSGDQTAYFDVSFFDQLRRLGGSSESLAQMYVVAHEFGHHIQFIEGTIGLIDYNNPGADSMAVAMEMQADCYAGMWASTADKGADAMLEPISEEQIMAAIQTARAVGDDNIQRRTTGQVQPDLWTHGSAEQRAQAFVTGYTQTSMAACDFPGFGHYQM